MIFYVFFFSFQQLLTHEVMELVPGIWKFMRTKHYHWWLRGWSVCLQGGRPGFNPWVGKIPRRRKWQPTPVFLPGKSHGRRSLVGYSPRGRKESDTTERLHSLTQTLSLEWINIRYIYMCMYIYMYICVHTHIYTHKYTLFWDMGVPGNNEIWILLKVLLNSLSDLI